MGFRTSSYCDTSACVEVDTAWRKSPYSALDNCVEVDAWRASSSYSGGGNCIQTATGRGAVRVRDSKDPDSPILSVSPAAWAVFTGSLRP